MPTFTGAGAPHWNPDLRGAFYGLSRGSGKAETCRAALEAIAFQCAEVLQAMEKDSGIDLKALRVDGGATGNDLLMQIQADLLGCEVVRPTCRETTALGAAALAGLQVDFWKDQAELAGKLDEERIFVPESSVQIAAGWERWRAALAATQHFSE